jgi:SOS response regulatory protein OraA/RecX
MELDKRDIAYSKVYAKVLNFLSFSKRSRKELLDKVDKYISKSGLDAKDKTLIKEQITLSLERDGYLKDDADVDFARSYIEGLRI